MTLENVCIVLVRGISINKELSGRLGMIFMTKMLSKEIHFAKREH